MALVKRKSRTDSLTIYIEGDGAAWITAYHPPRDPTPFKPTALALAAIDPGDAVAYLGRPCQYLDAPALANCSPIWWTTQRFAPEVLTAYGQALDTLKVQTRAVTLRLVGYSGGGVIAALLALRRQDVTSLITVASPLAVGQWTRLQGISPLAGSLDPLLAPGKLPPATHWIGSDDEIVPLSVIEQFALGKGGQVRPVKGYDHDCCWTRNWSLLLEESP
ncbi:alpha/beta hydrolase [Propionivibrio sp.]|uniref:alpha/beta hydrolase n=1 Tax=Propionivibrio sp. TaxID=2212460 RepID=UPI003BEFF3CF